ncbi:MAG: GDP-mannose 4,6-dehydratase [Thermoanaerobaculia bacterium]|nr:GDP-mannose 4,6-dehydratase [Thermoanaerobaculia bacterium]
MKSALICGLSGQDGSYLAKLLVGKGYRVVGASRDAQLASFGNLKKLGVYDEVELCSMSLNDFRSVLQVLARVAPDEIYNLAGQTSVGLSFEQPVETMESISLAALNLLEAIRFIERPVRLYNACSSECFGDVEGDAANESTPFRPRSPYAVAKAAAYWEVANYRDAYGIYACSGILFNHESPLRPSRFVTKKIVEGAARIAAGSAEPVYLGDVTVMRDWGFAPEYVEAMWRMLQQERPDDFVIATGEAHSVRDFCDAAYANRGIELEWHGDNAAVTATDRATKREVIKSDPRLVRPSDIRRSVGDASKAKAILGWTPRTSFAELVRAMGE